ncbi:CLUMA_CG005587, isoform A [Clunio marinus]|uniref:Metalloendopeptidase n=1 Tax=Clunio marinus TaxID=568069 RepID=A0A1J1HVA1_9DIPT|nr:CLUMA_CG005587, isoform A [Clunio marinus]
MKMKFLITLVGLSIFQCVLGNAIPNSEGAEYGDKVQGDLVVTNEQFNEMYNPSMRSGRTGLLSTNYRWPKNSAGQVEVPYTFRSSSGFTTSQQNVIISGMQEIEKYTCVRFIKRTNQVDYVEIISDSGCWSYLGRRGGQQTLSLQRNVNGYGCVWKGTAIHEFIHALGYTHMQNHIDRDKYVKVYLENVSSSQRHNFEKVTSSSHGNFNTEYDIESIMHYGSTAFSSNGKYVMLPYDSSKLSVMGQRERLSSGDIARIKNMYQC